ncbi:MAG: sulfatase-like hydrolase/transferase [Planctomycetota bacterium]|nr:sulfatase-like hydrolase/transferase [Planctomycetota bacterium]
MGPRRNGLIAAAACVLAVACQRERPGLEPRHVLLVTVENLRADRCSFLMHDRPTTWVPSDERMREEQRAFGLDDIATDGVVFARCYAPSPVRDVSLATLLSSRPPLENGVTQAGDLLPGEMVTLGEAFRAGGFRTAAFLGGASPPDASFTRGFEVAETFVQDLEALRAAASWLGRDPGAGERTFVWVHLAGLALPWTPREPVEEADAILADRVFVDPDYRGGMDASADAVQRVNAGLDRPTSADREALRALYERQIAHLSAVIWTGLHETYDFHTAPAEASETWSRTVFAFAGLNGLELLENGAIGAQGLLSDAALHVPLVLRHPDSLTGERIYSDVVGLADVAPTLLEWLRLPPLPHARGRSLLPVTDSYVERPFTAQPAFAQLPDRGVFSARDERWRLVWNPLGVKPVGRPAAAPALPEFLLHDMDADPAGIRDVARANPKVVARLVEAIRGWREAQSLFPLEKKPARAAAPASVR